MAVRMRKTLGGLCWRVTRRFSEGKRLLGGRRARTMPVGRRGSRYISLKREEQRPGKLVALLAVARARHGLIKAAMQPSGSKTLCFSLSIYA